MQNLGSVENSIPIQEIKIDNALIKNPEKTSLFISTSFNGKLKGFIAAASNRDIVIYNLEGNVIKFFIL
jgi:hypothetical protein